MPLLIVVQIVRERNEPLISHCIAILQQGLSPYDKFLPAADARFAPTVHPIPAREYIRVVLLPLGTRTHTN